MPYYIVGVKEVHVSLRRVEADSPEQAREDAASYGEEIDLRYDYTMEPETFTVEVE